MKHSNVVNSSTWWEFLITLFHHPSWLWVILRNKQRIPHHKHLEFNDIQKNYSKNQRNLATHVAILLQHYQTNNARLSITRNTISNNLQINFWLLTENWINLIAPRAMSFNRSFIKKKRGEKYQIYIFRYAMMVAN